MTECTCWATLDHQQLISKAADQWRSRLNAVQVHGGYIEQLFYLTVWLLYAAVSHKHALLCVLSL